MSHLTRAASAALAALGLAAGSAHADGIISYFHPEFPQVFAPKAANSVPTRVRAWSIFGAPNTWPAEVEVDVSCGDFEGHGTFLVTRPDMDGWVNLPTFRAPAEAQDCEMHLAEVGGTAVLALPVHVYDPATVVITPDLSGGIVTEATRPCSFVLTIQTASGQPITNNQFLIFPDDNHGASAEVDNFFFRLTDIDGRRVVNGTANNAVGGYTLILELHNVFQYRWFIPVRQDPAPPGAHRY
jgi:hypothetical protein